MQTEHSDRAGADRALQQRLRTGGHAYVISKKGTNVWLLACQHVHDPGSYTSCSAPDASVGDTAAASAEDPVAAVFSWPG